MIDSREYGYKVIGPIVFEYVSWILEQARNKHLESMYFLARDGCLLKMAAELICRRKGYQIQCKYLYCSRMALRMPTYHFIGDEAYDLLLQGGYHITPHILMHRLGLQIEERNDIYHEIGISIEDEEKALTHIEYCDLVKKLKKSRKYKEYMDAKSKASYENTIRYFRQKGLFDKQMVVIVDSGWSGSMQRSLRQLMEHEGYQGIIAGYYFGLFNVPKERADGEYNSYYFSAFRNLKHKVYFDNTWFECILSAPHGMTMGYQEKGGEVQPVLKGNMNEERNDSINAQIHGAMEYIEKYLEEAAAFSWEPSLRKTYRIVKRAVVYPTNDELEVFCDFDFCDDVAEAFSGAFVQKHMISKLENHMLIPKAVKKITQKNDEPIEDVYWPYGLVCYIPYPFRLWYRWNIIVLQWIRCIRLEFKEKRKVLNNE